MKKMIPVLSMFICATAIAQERVNIEPSGNIITKDISVQPFDAIKASGLYELVLSQGDKESVKIEADDNLQSLFSVSNSGSTLVVDMPKLKDQNINFKNKDDESLKLKVYVTFKKLKSIDVGVVGNVRSATPLKFDALEIESKNVGNVKLQLSANKLNVENKGVGNLTLSGTATNVTIKNSGVGQFDGEDLVVQTMDIENSGVGSANVNVEKDLKIKDTFLGKVRNKGNAKTHSMEGVEM
ncbi:MAG TPA: head GIN domain-containing protein [Chitinophagaceae bacterium]|jgi:hypothetical protein